MDCLEIRTLGDPVLRRKAAKVTSITRRIRTLAEQMLLTMYEEKGIGLAAPQVGVPKQLIVVDVQEEDSGALVLINPRIAEHSKRVVCMEEGCLSIPGLRAAVFRPERVVVHALNLSGKSIAVDADGLLARCLQHEIDHLNGILFIDYLAPNERARLLDAYARETAAQSAAERYSLSTPYPTAEE